MSKHSNSSSRIEKKISATAKGLLVALYPGTFSENNFYLEEGYYEGYRGKVWHQQWHYWWPVDYWGESDSDDCYWLLYSWLIDKTTDFEGMSKAEEDNHWQPGTNLEPFYSPWRGASRAEIIRHCRELVKSGVTLERMH